MSKFLSTADLSSSTLIIPTGTGAAPTAEGQMYWNSSSDSLTVGNGTTATVMAVSTGSVTMNDLLALSIALG